MQHELNHTVQVLLGARGLDEVSRETLASLVREYPYSALLHLLYSKKLQQAQDTQYADSVARTALYFSNPHWLHHLLRPKTSREAVREMEKAFDEHVHDVPVAQPEQAVSEQSTELPVADTDRPALEQETPEFTEAVDTGPSLEEPHSHTMETGVAVDFLPTPVEEDIPQVQESEGSLPAAQWLAPDVRPLEAAPETPDIDIPPIDTAATEKPVSVTEAVSETQAPVATGSPSMPSGPVIPPDTGLIPLEPYYTIDYFASQGIQLSDEEKLDPLGRKLKRFTDWLKTMKKIHPDKSRPVTGEDHADETIRQGAEHSNDRADVVTEAMAEVYLKQGQKEKAAEIYRKLSLLDPSRSATFAAKIADLNTPDA